MTEKFKKLFPEAAEKDIKKAGYQKEEQFEQAQSLQEHLKRLEEKDEIGELNPEELAPIEDKITPESRERLETVANNMIDCFDWQPDQEGFAVITDTRVMRENPELIFLVEEVLKERAGNKGHFRLMVAPESKRSTVPLGKSIGESMKGNPVLILTSRSRTHSLETGAAIRGDLATTKESLAKILKSGRFKETVKKGQSVISPKRLKELQAEIPDKYFDKLIKMAKEKGSRVISCTKGHNPFEILTKGAVEESVEKLKERAEKVDNLMKEVEKVHITSQEGTDLWLDVRPDKSEIEDGQINKPGKVSNYPIGEWSCSLKWEGSQGTLVVNGPCGGGLNKDKIDQPIRLTIEQGEVKTIEGGKASELLKEYLDQGNDENNGAFKVAELGIGTNSKAVEGKPEEYWGSSETEKKYGTVHVAVGSNGTFGVKKDDPYYNPAAIHCDMILLGKINVECVKKDGSTFKLIEQGTPQGY